MGQPARTVELCGQRAELETAACDFCGATDFYPFWNEMRHGVNLPSVLCKTCGLCMTNPRPTEAFNTEFYEKYYHRFHKFEAIDENSEYFQRSKRLAIPRVDVLGRFLEPDKPYAVLEIGAGVGQFQTTARTATAWNISGIEPSGESFAMCQKQRLAVQQLFVEDLSDGEQYDAVASFHVFEHLRSPRAFLEKVHRLLKPGGLLHLEVPNLSRPGGTLSNFFQLPHLYSFTATTLRNYLRRSGFAPIYVAERNQTLTMIAHKSEAVASFERFDVENFMQRMKIHNRLQRAAQWIPRVSLLGTIRSNVEAI